MKRTLQDWANFAEITPSLSHAARFRLLEALASPLTSQLHNSQWMMVA
jgi:hypothetical protein